MTPSFEYEDCHECICGEGLPDAVEVSKTYAWGKVHFRRCPECGSFVQSPRITVSSIAAWYDSESYQNSTANDEGPYVDYIAQEQQRRIEAESRYQRELKALLPSRADVVEVGCATGSLLAVMRDAGHRVTGVELSRSFATSARELNGLDLAVGDFRDFESADASFDLVLMLGTISNLPALGDQLRQVRRLLRSTGAFYFNLPVADSLPARLYGKRYWMFAPSVCSFMTRAGIRAALARAGLAVVGMRRDRQRPTLAKLAGHAGAKGLNRPLTSSGLGAVQLPIPIIVPGVWNVIARPATAF
ncbi:MAG: class I SAM-dependent methyltransferase [Gammaproteobacteria bacterium]